MCTWWGGAEGEGDRVPSRLGAQRGGAQSLDPEIATQVETKGQSLN